MSLSSRLGKKLGCASMPDPVQQAIQELLVRIDRLEQQLKEKEKDPASM